MFVSLLFFLPHPISSHHSHIVIARPDKISGADIAAICQEAGMQAIRHNRYVVLAKDFERAYRNVVRKTDTEFAFYQ